MTSKARQGRQVIRKSSSKARQFFIPDFIDNHLTMACLQLHIFKSRGRGSKPCFRQCTACKLKAQA
ncbi:MAG: hypothetical protein D5S03_03195 [Desulfonatronospira sp. MSAO_Bac3]|nr:MAG: hypothetical protein D5S03_03195 [Desulfonatronospira sp. MSAO_Bac3]